MIHWAKQNIMLYVFNFKEGVRHMYIRLYGFSVHQTFKIGMPILSLMKK